MNHRRNIIIYSEKLIETNKFDLGEESRSIGPDLLVSYHNKNHYNSVKRKWRLVSSAGDEFSAPGGGVEESKEEASEE